MKLKIFLFAAMALVLAGCAANPLNPAAPTTAGAPVALENTQWRLASFGAVGSEAPVLPGSDVTLQFGADGTVGGNSGCNSFGGKYSLTNDMLVLSELNSTLRACLDENANQQEQRYLEALQTTGKVELAGDQLKIQYDGGNSVLTFNRATS
jgi:heat shock protein HslJ